MSNSVIIAKVLLLSNSVTPPPADAAAVAHVPAEPSELAARGAGERRGGGPETSGESQEEETQITAVCWFQCGEDGQINF